ncbi:hypothetical protein [Streptomyces sp. NBC_01497]|uniref:hypothetical protein n=1 Tax=Streptomyces sp. NBC_01497 TaxID=2903885 RepID=UPI002E34E062|nr:hypothetical protein [Streptomyces sp. NBC_01497]
MAALHRAGVDGLCDDPRSSVPLENTDADVDWVIVKTLEESPTNATRWSTWSMAAATGTGMSQWTVSRIWRALSWHRTGRRRSSCPSVAPARFTAVA